MCHHGRFVVAENLSNVSGDRTAVVVGKHVMVGRAVSPTSDRNSLEFLLDGGSSGTG